MSSVLPDGASRELVIEAAMGQLRERPLHTLSLESVAATLGVRRGTVGVHFPTWEALLTAVVEEWNGQRLAPRLPIVDVEGAVPFLRSVIDANSSDPSHPRLLIGAANIAAYPGLPVSAWLREQYLAFYALVTDAFARDQQTGRETGQIAAALGAEQLLAMYEGLSLQSLVRPGKDLVGAFDRAVVYLRRGWAASGEGVAAAGEISRPWGGEGADLRVRGAAGE